MKTKGLSALAVAAILLAAVLVPAMGLGSLNKVENNKTYVEEQDFTWGVLAINTNKSIYLPDETAFIGMAVLDYEGQMVCDANVTLAITDPGNKETVLSTSTGSINVSPECSVYGVTNLPDYYTNYTVGGVGTYVMNLTAVTSAGVYSITDNFTVQSSVDFDVARDGPTRIYPVVPVPYRMKFTIKANKNYNGLINEYVPASFAITPQEGLTVTTVGDTKILSWNKNLIKGETYNIYYEFDAPDISPYLFVLGDLEIDDWHEARRWLIASDQTGGCQCKTIASGIIRGGIYDESYGKYPAGEKYTDENGHIYWKLTHEFQNVPSNIILARVRTGCWGGSPCNGGDGFNISINGFTSANYNAIDPCHDTTLRCDVLNWSNNSNSPSTTGVCQLDTTGCGQSYIKYNATPHVGPGSNTITMIQRRATVNPQDWGGSWASWHGWGAAYGIFFLRLFVLYENESMPETHYFINEGTTLIVKESECEDNSYESFIYFNGSKVYTGSARKVTLSYPAPGSTGVSYFNGHNLTGGYPWSDIPPGYLVPFNNLFYYYDGTMPEPGKQIFDRTVWTHMLIEYERSDLTVTNISAQTRYANYYNTINATVLNNVGNVSSFNLTLYANDTKIDVKQISALGPGESKEVSFTWKPTSEGTYELNVTADAGDIVLETNEANNTKTEIVNVEPAPVPIWRNQSSNVTEIPNGGSIELRAQGSAKHGLDYAVLWTDETGTWMGCNNYGSPMETFSLDSFSLAHTSDADWNAQTRDNLAVSGGDVKLLWTEAGANIALYKSSYASNSDPSYPPGDGNDGDEYNTWWYAPVPGDYVYDWWYVDLGEITTVGEIIIRDVGYLGEHGHYDINISDDASSWTTTEIANQWVDIGATVIHDNLDWSCRYVRFHVEHNDGAGFAEFEVYGKSGYKSSGLLTSTATSTGNPIVSVTPTWNSDEPLGTILSVNVSVDNGATWTPANKDEELTWDYDVPNTNLKYKVLFETTNTSKTPVLHDITLNYKTKDAPKGTWVWSNFTWQNASVTAGTTVAWKICYNDTAEQTTCTDVMTFDVAAPDTTPPYTAGHDPAPGATGVPRNTNITVHVKDDGEGVDESTLVMKVDGSPVTPVISGSPADYTLVYDPPNFDFGHVVHVTVDASDLASPPNEMTTDSYSFTIVGDKPDLIIKNIDAYHNAIGYPPYFNLSNEVDVMVKNVGGTASGSSNVSLYINESYMGKKSVSGLGVGSSETVQFKWTPGGCDCEDGCNPDTFILEAMADCDGVIAELNESNNASTVEETAYWNGYSADELLETVQHGTIHGGLNFTTGDGDYISLTTHGSSKDIHYNLTLPSGATVALARLNVYYLWSKYDYPIMTVNITNQTGTHTVPLSKSYNDRPCSSPGVSSNNPSGNYVYNVTPYITGSGDYTVTVKNDGNETNESSFAIYAPGLVILYEDSTAPEYEYWILEGADMLGGGRKSGSGNLALPECINNATLPGIDSSNVARATLGLVTPAGDGSGSDSYLYFNGNEIGTDVYHGHSSQYSKTLNGIAMHIGSTNAQVGVNISDVKEYLDTSSNIVGQGDDGDSMVVANVFLLVEQVAVSDTTPPTWDITTGIQTAIDTGVGGEVTVTYGNATDTGSPPVKYNIYYNVSSPATGGTKKSDVGSSPYTVTGLTNGQQYYFAVRVEDSATPPNEDTNTVNLTATPTDTTPPASITGLQNVTYEQTYINWTWTNPEDGDFNYTMVYINGAFQTNTSNEWFNATGLSPSTNNTISTHTVDTSGNVNISWVNHSAWTAPTPPSAPIIKLRREQANTTGVNQATTVRLIVWNTDSSENNITSLNLTEWIDSNWTVTDCGGCDENTSTYIKWNLGDLPRDNYTMVFYKIKAPASSEISTFKANCTYKYDGKTGSEEGSEFLVSVQTGKAFFDFELDMNAFTPTIDRDVPEGTEKTVKYSVTNVGDAVPCDTVFIELKVNKTAWDVTCAYCDEFYNDADYYYLKWIEEGSSWGVQQTKVFNFTVNSSHVGYYNFTSNGTYDPPASANAFIGQIYYPGLMLDEIGVGEDINGSDEPNASDVVPPTPIDDNSSLPPDDSATEHEEENILYNDVNETIATEIVEVTCTSQEQISNVEAKLVYDVNETPIPNKEICFYRDTALIDSELTNGEGWAAVSFDTSELPAGNYTISVIYKGDETLSNAAQQIEITLVSPTPTPTPTPTATAENETANETQEPENITDDLTPPIVTLISPTNTTYNNTEIELNYTVNAPADWVAYSLNGLDNVTITGEGNTTLNASAGLNMLTVYANDSSGNVGSASVQFVVNITNVTATAPEPENITAEITPVLVAMKEHFPLNEKPAFKFKFSVNAFSKRVGLKTLATPTETIKTAVYYKDELVDIEPEIEELREGEFSIEIPTKRAFQAGLYKLRVELVKDNVTYVEEQDFTWGVLAINTHKSIYLPNETAFIGIAVLDDEGHMVCDAVITLTITDPDNKETVLSTDNGLIKVSPECSVYGVTNLPDYYTNYEVNGVGTYVMNLTAVTADGAKSIIDDFTVQNSVDFDVARDGPTRIYPPVPYVMNFIIKANKNYTGLIKEYVPASFVITPQDGLTVTTAGDTKILTWNKNLVKGETYKVGYEFDAPDVSPYLFTLGRLQIGSFEERRDWMIVSDAPDVETLDPIVHVNTELNGVDLDQAQVDDITNDDINNVEVDKGLLLTVEFNDTSQTIGTLNDAYCSLTYSTDAGFAGQGNFKVYDSFGGTQVDTITIPESTSGNTIHLVDLETKGLSASKVTTMIVYLENTVGTQPKSFYVDKIVCTIDYTPSADTTPPTYTNDGDNSSGSVTEGAIVETHVYWTDANSNLGNAVLRTNKTGEWTNESWHTFSGNPEWANITFNTIGHAGKTICWAQWANDTSNNNNWNTSMSTTAHCFNVLHVTKISQVLINDTSPNQGDSVKIEAKLEYDNGTTIADQNVSFYYDTSYIDYDFSNETGWATINWDTTGVNNGTYNINATYSGNSSIYTKASYNNTQEVTVTEKIWVTNIEVHFVRVRSAAAMDTAPPASITSLHNTTYAPTYINWSWINPEDADFSHVRVYIDGTFKENVFSPSDYYNATGFTANTQHTISTHTVDTSGNINLSWVNHSAWTAPAPAGAPTVEIITITPDDDPSTSGVQINPVPNSTKTVNITAQVNDPNGYEDIQTVEVSNINPAPTQGSTATMSYVSGSGSGTTATYEGTFDMQFYDASENYTVTVTATDTGSLTGSNSSSFEYQTCIALELDVASIDFGSVDPGSYKEVIGDTVFPNAAPTIKNCGNLKIDMKISGTNMSGSGTIPVNNIYDDLNNPDGYTALSTTPAEHDELNLTAGASSVHGIDFKLNVPSGTSAGGYSGTVTLEAKLDD